MWGDISSQQVRVQVFGFHTGNSQRVAEGKKTLQTKLLQTHPGIIISPPRIEKLKPVGQLVPLLWSQSFVHGSV